MPKITNRLEEIKYWNQKKREYAIKASKKSKAAPVLKNKKDKTKKTPIRKKSKTQIKRDVKYAQAKKEYIASLDNEMCEVRLSPECIKVHQVGTEIHHQEGKIGDRYFDKSKFKLICRFCHNYELNNDKEAKEKGVTLYRNRIN